MYVSCVSSMLIHMVDVVDSIVQDSEGLLLTLSTEHLVAGEYHKTDMLQAQAPQLG